MLSNYCGPGGSGKLRHRTDWICKIHDAAYDYLKAKGIDPYWTCNEADHDMLNDMIKYPPERWDEWVIQNAAAIAWNTKHKLFTHSDLPVREKMAKPPRKPPNPMKALKYAERHVEKKLQQEAQALEQENSHEKRDRTPSMADTHSSKRQAVTTTEAMPAHGTLAAQDATQDGDQSAPGVEGALEPIHHVWRRFPNVETAELKWVYTQLLGNSSQNTAYRPSGSAYDQQAKRDIGSADTYNTAQATLNATPAGGLLQTPMLIQYRMTSPYNIMSKTDTGNLSQPQWLSYFDSRYQYYHVIKARWRISITLGINDVGGTTVQQYAGIYAYWKYTNFDDPPTQFTVDNTGKTTYIGTTLNLTPDDYDRMGGWNKVWIQLKNTKAVRKVITGEYETGQCRMDVKMLSDPVHSNVVSAEGWTKVKSTPAFPEILSLILVDDNGMVVATSNFDFSIRSEIDYLIQFRDLQSYYKFPVQSADAGTSTDIKQYFYQGQTALHPQNLTTTDAAVGTYN